MWIFDFSILYIFVKKAWNLTVKELKIVYFFIVILAFLFSFLQMKIYIDNINIAILKNIILLLIFNPFFYFWLYKLLKLIKKEGKYEEYKQKRLENKLDEFYDDLEKEDNWLLDNIAILFYWTLQFFLLFIFFKLSIVFSSFIFKENLSFLKEFIPNFFFLIIIVVASIIFFSSINLLFKKNDLLK